MKQWLEWTYEIGVQWLEYKLSLDLPEEKELCWASKDEWPLDAGSSPPVCSRTTHLPLPVPGESPTYSKAVSIGNRAGRTQS